MRWLRKPVVALVALGVLAGEAPAQFGFIPQVVFDPQAAADAYVRFTQLRDAGNKARDHLQRTEQVLSRLREDSKQFSGFRIPDFAGSRRGYERLFEASPLGYNNPGLDRIFRAAFPESRIDDAIRGASAAQQEMIRRAAYTLVAGAGRQGEQLRDAERALDRVRQLAASAGTQAQMQQSQAAIDALAVEEAQQARQLQIAATNQQAAMDAYQVTRDARADSVSAASAADHAERQERARENLEAWRKRQAVPERVWRPGARVEDLGIETGPGASPQARKGRP
ncbi:MAG TPA: hypothetical protein VF263_08615 [Longimicrobiaceae bacterium]